MQYSKQANVKLDFQSKRADQYEQKYKSAIKFKNQQIQLRQMLNQMDQKLRNKQNQQIQLMRRDQEKNQCIKDLNYSIQKLNCYNNDLRIELNQIKEAALSAIIEKDHVINELTDKLEQYKDKDGINDLKAHIVDIQEKYRQLQERMQFDKIQFLHTIEGKDEQINQLHDKITSIKQKNYQRVSRLQQQIADYEKHIEQVNAEKDHEDNLEEKYYLTEQKLKKIEKKLSQADTNNSEEKGQFIAVIQKLELQVQILKTQNQESKEIKNRLKQVEKQNNHKKKDIQQLREKFEKNNIDFNKKCSNLEGQKKIMNQNLDLKQQQIQRLRGQIEKSIKLYDLNEETNDKNHLGFSLASQIQHRFSPTKKLISKQNNQQALSMIEKLKKQNKQLEQNNNLLKKRIQEQTKELQDSRQKLLLASGSGRSTEQAKYLLQIEQLNSYLKKIENNMLLKKITHAEDENFWTIKGKKYKQQIEGLNKKYRKQTSELLERIDRMKKVIPKDKKIDYYQSGFK